MYEFDNIKILNDRKKEQYYNFFLKTGLYNIFCDKEIKNLVDYIFGVEVGLNSNARKNRTGTVMENITNLFLRQFCQKNVHFSFIEQANKKKIKETFNVNINIDKNNRRFDFALYDKRKEKLYLIEVNFYNSGGSKLKATAGEYKELNDFLKKQNLKFIWITDGKGWLKALNPLEETFYHNDNVINLQMLKDGILEIIVNKYVLYIILHI